MNAALYPAMWQIGAFRADVLAGLSLNRKTMPSRWLYDAHGCALFGRIARAEGYRPARAQAEVLRTRHQDIAAFLGANAVVVEYVAAGGDNATTELLLEASNAPAAYVPVDPAGVSPEASRSDLARRFPGLPVLPVDCDFTMEFDMPEDRLPGGRRTLFIPGAMIGRLDPQQAVALLLRMHRRAGADGGLLVGFDLFSGRGNPIAEYDGLESLTAAFALNLLARINRELEADFPLERFVNELRWNAEALALEMYLVSLDRCSVTVSGRRFKFEADESVHLHSARKFTVEGIHELARRAGWRVTQAWSDPSQSFAVVGLRAANA